MTGPGLRSGAGIRYDESMPAVDWTLLEPHRPLVADQESFHASRPDGGAAKLASLVLAGANPIAIVGPMGSGKSTEMMMAARQLIGGGSHIGTSYALDHADPGTPPVAASRVVNLMCGLLARLYLAALSSELKQKLQNAGLLPIAEGVEQASPRILAPDLLRETLREVPGGALTGRKPAVLFCDGLEKYSADKAQEILNALLPFQTEATLVVVAPTSLVYGPASYDIVSSFKLFHVRAVPVRDERGLSGTEGRAFLKTIVIRRLGLDHAPLELDDLMDRAAEASGGIPRAFLQLVLDAGMYARLAQREWPTRDDLGEAMSDHLESLRRRSSSRATSTPFAPPMAPTASKWIRSAACASSRTGSCSSTSWAIAPSCTRLHCSPAFPRCWALRERIDGRPLAHLLRERKPWRSSIIPSPGRASCCSNRWS